MDRTKKENSRGRGKKGEEDGGRAEKKGKKWRVGEEGKKGERTG